VPVTAVRISNIDFLMTLHPSLVLPRLLDMNNHLSSKLLYLIIEIKNSNTGNSNNEVKYNTVIHLIVML
jgi:hypothetical protein